MKLWFPGLMQQVLDYGSVYLIRTVAAEPWAGIALSVKINFNNEKE